ncbi:MAG TPA: hypothetical protein ENK76_02540 [Campylobacterales bacterium]|nr:hypothetical protein [Campylobacterales bacterium]
MCKILIILVLGLMLTGCNQNQPEPKSSNRDINITRKPLVTKKHAGCKLLASGYLVCPKVR